MQRFVLAASALVLLAGQALSLNIALGGAVGTIPASQFLTVPNGPYVQACANVCDPPKVAIMTCGDSDDQCLCTTALATQITACEQCMLDDLVKLNIRGPDVRAGSNAALSAYTTACNASAGVVFTPALALKVSPDFHSMQEANLNVPSTVVVVGFGAILGGSALWILSNIA